MMVHFLRLLVRARMIVDAGTILTLHSAFPVIPLWMTIGGYYLGFLLCTVFAPGCPLVDKLMRKKVSN
jgi:hypothetical protein